MEHIKKHPTLSIIVAMSRNNVIGKENQLPWGKMPRDMKRFKDLTMGHVVLMGRKTYESIPSQFRPLPGRVNIILTRIEYCAPGAIVLTSLQEVFEEFRNEEIFVAGGGEIYNLLLPYAQKIYLTRVESDVEGDTYFPVINENWKESSREEFPKDDRHEYPLSFSLLERVEERKVVDLSFAKGRGDYEEVLATIQREQKCPFCPDNFRHHRKPILEEHGSWFITEASWPYPDTQHHFLLIGRNHGETFNDLMVEDWLSIRMLVRWAVEKFNISGGGFALRFGETQYTGATVCHIHAHLIVPNMEGGKAKIVNFPIG